MTPHSCSRCLVGLVAHVRAYMYRPTQDENGSKVRKRFGVSWRCCASILMLHIHSVSLLFVKLV